MIPKRPNAPEENVDSWLMSYADMITLLLSFFIIFVATSEPKEDKMARATRGMQEQFGTISFESPYDGVYRDIAGIVATNHADRFIGIDKTARGVQIQILGRQYFAPGTADLVPGESEVIRTLFTTLKEKQLSHYTVVIEGHTSNLPPEGGTFSNNWDLSAMRANRIRDLMEQAGLDSRQMYTVSYADTRPAVPNADAMGNEVPVNQERNERIVVKVEQQK